MFRIGVTGGIGSGKSTVCRMMQERGVPVYYADQEAHNILNGDLEVRQKVSRLLGDVYVNDKLDRGLVSGLVFSDKEKLDGINSIMRPAIKADFDRWVRSQCAPYVLLESAILIESGGHRSMDHVIVVTATDEVRIARSMARDNASREQIEKKIAAQMSQEELLEYADSVITNNSTKEALVPQVRELYHYLDEIVGSQGLDLPAHQEVPVG